MSAPDLHTLTGAYAANALPDQERRAFEEHLGQCQACADEVAELTATVARLASAVAAPAPAGLRSRVLAEIEAVRQQPPTASALSSARGDDARPWFREPLGVAAALLLVVSLGLGALAVVALHRAQVAEDTAARIAAVATDPHRVTERAGIAGGGTGTVLAAGSDALFSARDLPRAPAGKTYQLWVIDEHGPRSAGVLDPGIGGTVERLVPAVSTGSSIGLTVEPSGGSKRPTTEPILLLPIST